MGCPGDRAGTLRRAKQAARRPREFSRMYFARRLRLIGELVDVRLYAEELEVWFASKVVD